MANLLWHLLLDLLGCRCRFVHQHISHFLRLFLELNRLIATKPVAFYPGRWGVVMYIVSKAGAQKLLDLLLLPDGRWNMLVWAGSESQSKMLEQANHLDPTTVLWCTSLQLPISLCATALLAEAAWVTTFWCV